MLEIRTVLCPVDFTALNTREIQLAVEVCRSFGARLILHHNLDQAPLGPATSWMWHREHRHGHTPEEKATTALREMLSGLPGGVQAEARLSSGMAAPAILQLEDQVEADLVVMATHGATTADHTSIAEQIVERSRCPVLVLHDGAESPLRLSFGGRTRLVHVLVPTDLSPSSERAVRYAFDLSRLLSLRLHLLHVIVPRKSAWVETGVSMAGPQVREGAPSEEARDRLAAMVPEDLTHRVDVHVKIGEPAEKIEELAGNLGVACIVMGAHARSFLRRLFTHDTSRELLHQAPCPVWFVPQIQAA
jgi:nucleotide-binding universal stress UspA family protein